MSPEKVTDEKSAKCQQNQSRMQKWFGTISLVFWTLQANLDPRTKSLRHARAFSRLGLRDGEMAEWFKAHA